MRRIWSFLLPLILALSLTSCGQSAEAKWQEQYDLGMRYLSEGNYEEAIIAFTAAIDIDPKRAEAFLGRGDAYLASGDSEDNLIAAEEDYLAALALDDQLEEVYEKLSQLYETMGDSQRSLEILEAGADVLNSDRLRRKAEERQAGAYSDEELLELARENLWTVYNLQYAISAGAYFEQDWDNYVETEVGQMWFPVVDERVHSLADVEAYWNQYFSSHCPLPEDSGYREIDGRLYCRNTGIGGDVTLLDYVLTDVQSRDGTSATLTGYVLRDDRAYIDSRTYQNHFLYKMDFEDGAWKCSAFVEGDRIYDAVPEDREQSSPMFTDTFWHWKVSPGNGGSFYALFHGDGSFSYIRPTDLSGSIGTYEYDGDHLYLNGVEYAKSGQSFTSTEEYDVMGGEKWSYTLKADGEQKYRELEAQLHS